MKIKVIEKNSQNCNFRAVKDTDICNPKVDVRHPHEVFSFVRKLSTRFGWKIRDRIKTLNTQITEALKSDCFEHDGASENKDRIFWVSGNGNWPLNDRGLMKT